MTMSAKRPCQSVILSARSHLFRPPKTSKEGCNRATAEVAAVVGVGTQLRQWYPLHTCALISDAQRSLHLRAPLAPAKPTPVVNVNVVPSYESCRHCSWLQMASKCNQH